MLLGGVSHSITQERRRIAWGCVNPANTLPEDQKEGKEKEVTLFGGGFLERATKRIEKAKELEKVTGSRPSEVELPGQRPQQFASFLEKGAPARYGGGNSVRHKPHNQQQRFQNQKERKQETKQLETEQLTHVHTNLLNNTISHIPCISQLPPASPLLLQLASYNRRPMDAAGGDWLQARASVDSSSRCGTSVGDGQGRPGRRGSSEASEERSYKGSAQLPWSIPQPHLSGAQEGWLIQTSGQSEATESVHRKSTFQDGEPGNDKKPAEEQQLDGFNRRLFVNSS